MRLIDAYRDTWGGRPIDPKEMRAAVERELIAALTTPAASAQLSYDDAAFERGRLQGMEQERALWKLSAEAQADGSYAPAEPAQAQGEDMEKMAARFLTWPVPASVYPDGTPGKPGRTGTNLLSAPEAREMLAYVLATPQAAESVELPPLPEPAHHLVRIVTDAGPTTYFTAPSDQRGYPVYTADQMRAYGRLCAGIGAPATTGAKHE
jgi:hypothetical protein